MLGVAFGGLVAGGGLYLAGWHPEAELAWLAVTAIGLLYALVALAGSLRRRRAGVDIIAVLALAGAIAVDELVAGAVITVMLASARALEGWAASRARRDLSGLLARAPSTARRDRNGSLETVPLDQIGPGDLVLVAQGISSRSMAPWLPGRPFWTSRPSPANRSRLSISTVTGCAAASSTRAARLN
jgi:cation transport ATPase